MPSPTTAAGEAGLTSIISQPSQALLAFDFDGVLSPMVEDPDQAQPVPGIFRTLADLGGHAGLIAIVTGRPVSFVMSRHDFQLLDSIPRFAVFGQYGLERWDTQSRQLTSRPVTADIAAARAELAALLRQPGVAEGSWLEDKGSAVAVHTRRTADPAGALAVLSQPVHDLARRYHLRVEPGKMVLEIRPPDVHKGDVLREVVGDRGFGSVLYAGDDLGDLSAFAVVDELRAAGVAGVKVCSASAEAPAVAEAADLVVEGPAGVQELLTDLRQEMAP